MKEYPRNHCILIQNFETYAPENIGWVPYGLLLFFLRIFKYECKICGLCHNLHTDTHTYIVSHFGMVVECVCGTHQYTAILAQYVLFSLINFICLFSFLFIRSMKIYVLVGTDISTLTHTQSNMRQLNAKIISIFYEIQFISHSMKK